MVDPDVLQRRLVALRRHRQILQELHQKGKDAFLKDPILQGSTERYLHLAAEAMLDMAAHVVADRKLGIAEQYKDLFDLLSKGGIISHPFADRLKEWAKFRNILVHAYLEVDPHRIWETLEKDLGDIDEFVRLFGRFLTP